MDNLNNFWTQIRGFWNKLNLYSQNYGLEILLILGISIILSIFFYIILGRVRRHILVDLGHHKWIIK